MTEPRTETAADPSDPRLTDAEWIVMDALWRLARGTAREVLDKVDEETGWAYTTVKTMLDRLADKGLLVAGRGGPATIYRPRVERAEAQRSAVRQLRERAFGGSARAMARTVLDDDVLTPADRRDLARRAAADDEVSPP